MLSGVNYKAWSPANESAHVRQKAVLGPGDVTPGKGETYRTRTLGSIRRTWGCGDVSEGIDEGPAGK